MSAETGKTPRRIALKNIENVASATNRTTTSPSSLDSVLKERGSRYGSFVTHAAITQQLKAVMMATPKWRDLAYDQKEALEMAAHKIGRILNGDPNYVDSWTDIAGYITLVEKRLMIGEEL